MSADMSIYLSICMGIYTSTFVGPNTGLVRLFPIFARLVRSIGGGNKHFMTLSYSSLIVVSFSLSLSLSSCFSFVFFAENNEDKQLMDTPHDLLVAVIGSSVCLSESLFFLSHC